MIRLDEGEDTATIFQSKQNEQYFYEYLFCICESVSVEMPVTCTFLNLSFTRRISQCGRGRYINTF